MNLIFRSISTWLTALGMIVATLSFGQGGEPALIKVLDGVTGNFKVDSFVTVEDTKWWTPAQKATIDTTLPYKVRNIITLKFFEESTKFIKSDFSDSVYAKIIYTNKNNSVDSIGYWFTINFDDSSGISYSSQRIFSFYDGYRVTVRIDTVRNTFPAGVTAWDVTPHLRLENEMQITRYYNFACTSALLSLNQSTASITSTGDLRYTWSPVTGATEYDIEWTFIDSAMLAEGILYGTVATPDRTKIFEAGSTRNTVYNGDFYVPLFYDNSSYLFVRVRPVQLRASNQRIEGAWYPSTGAGYYFTGHETGLNWQSTTTFAEEGKRKTVISYADGSLKQRQTVTRDNVAVSTPQAIASETLYDFQGRPAIQVLPAPGLGGVIKYIHDLNKSLAGGEYEKSLYDSLINPADYCEGGAPAMNNSSGANKYYSSGSGWAAINNSHKALPVANGFAFAETRYAQDNTGRIMAQGGVGQQYQIGSKHETKYYYGKPDSLELFALFGTEVGDPAHYQKNMVRDANSQYSVSYVDMKGRTIATALAGVPDTSLVKIDTLSSYDSITITKKLLDRSTTVIDGLSMTNTAGLIVTKAGIHTFRYTLSPDSLRLPTCTNSNICYDCVYNLEISISDECNNQLLPSDQRYVLLDSNFTMATLDTLCNTINTFDTTFTLYLKEGSYNIAKKLSVSRPGYEYYRDSVFMVKNLCKTFDDFYAEELSVLQQNCAGQTCASCNTALGSLIDFRDSYAAENAIPTDQLTEYETQIVQAYNTAKANCDLICDSLSENDGIKEMMLADMRADNGQYANPDDSLYEKNIFYRASSGDPYVYQQVSPAYYVDENGKRDSIYNSAGELVPPDHASITPADFIAQYKFSWAETLLPKHPEYCKYQANEQLRYSSTWDKRFTETDTYADAKLKGFLNPINQSGSGYAFMPIVSGGQDPLSSVSATLGGQTLYNILKDKVLYYITNGGNSRSMWGLATATAHCNDDETCFTTYLQNTNAFDSVHLCRGELDMAWRTFQQLYSSEKRRLISNWIESQCTYVVPDSFYVYFPDIDNLLDGLDIGSNDENTNIAAAKDSINSIYGSNCEAYVKNWWRQIAPCNFNYTDSLYIIPRLIQVCKEGSDASHSFGSSSVKPSSMYEFRSFDQVINHYLDSTGRSSEYNTNCNGYLITAPAPYEQPAAYADLPLWAKPDSCQCEKFDSLYQRFLATPANDSNFAGYVKRKLNVDMTEGDLQTILDMCSGIYTCKFLEQPINIPPQLQCGFNSNCMGCDSISAWNDRFMTTFADTAIYDGNDSLQGIKNLLYQRYMNYHTGLNKSYTEYLQMIDSCPVTNVTCDTLKQVLNDFREEYYHTPSYSIAYNADGCDTTSWSFVHTDTSSVGKAKYAHMFSNGQMHPPDSMFNYVTGNWFDSAKMKLINFTYPRKICSVENEFRWDIKLRHNTFFGSTAVDGTLLSMKLRMSGASVDSTLYIYLNQDNPGRIIFGGEGSTSLYDSPLLQVDLISWKIVSVRITGNKIKVYVNGVFRYERSYTGNIVEAGYFTVNPHYTDVFVDYVRIFNGSGQVILSENFTNACESFSVLNPAYDCNKDDCTSAFVDFYNDARGTSLNESQIQQLYVTNCGREAQPCLAEDNYEDLKLCPDGALFPSIVEKDQGPCSDSSALAFALATEKFSSYKDSLRAAFDSVYLGKCMKAYQYENLTVAAPQSEFHFTLYYYDQAGNLVRTVPPSGVDISKFGHLESWKDSVRAAKIGNQVLRPSHQLPTNYRYNTLNQVKAQKSPDGGNSKFWYDRLGRLVLSQNAKQLPGDWYSYTVYDSIGRITEVGELLHDNGPTTINDSMARSQSALNDLITLNTRRQITNTYYDAPYAGFSGLAEPLVAKHLRSRVSYTTYTEGDNPALYDQATFYSYDIHGNVDTLLQDYRTGVMNDQGHRFKKLVYQFDLISGKVNHVAYQANKMDQFYHRYSYDGENRVKDTYTSSDSTVWERDAMYNYLMHGPLARTVLGQQKVQGQDYAYTLQGWLKAINGVGTTFEVGNDGTTITAANQYVAKDAYAIMLHYNSSDYSSALSTCNCVSNTLTLPATHTMKNLYNGNIAGMSVSIPKINRNMNSSTYLGSLYYNYKYDQLNRLKGMDAYTKSFISASTLRYDSVLTDYKEQISYDANGNILKYQRNGTTLNSMQVTMDKLNYQYYAGTNQLRQVTDSVNSTYYSEDIDNQADTSNYHYDAIGNLVKDSSENIKNILWNVYGKISEIHKTADTIRYTYDAGGNRISKTVWNSSDTTVTWYVRDATGNVMGVYRFHDSIMYQDELHLYGSSRIGILKPERNLNLDAQVGDTSGTLTLLGTWKGGVFRRGVKFFELANHLGNVLATISDKKLGVDANADGNVEFYNPDVMSANDYYPFGMVMTGRMFAGGNGYRYGFNGKEKNSELNESDYDFGARMYEARIGRFKSLDPEKALLVSISHYTFALNGPIRTIDADGEFPILINGNTSNDKERGSPTYWDKSILTTISSKLGYKMGDSFDGAYFPAGSSGTRGSTFSADFLFVDGNRGKGSGKNMWPNNRKEAGVAQAKADAAGVWAKLKQSMNKEGQITEKIEIISHSRGGSFANGYVEELKSQIDALATKEKVGFAYDKGMLVDLVVHLAPHQSNFINVKESSTATVGVSHIGDPLSGNDIDGDVMNVHAAPEDNTSLDPHGNKTYNKVLGAIIDLFNKGGKKDITNKTKLKEAVKAATIPDGIINVKKGD